MRLGHLALDRTKGKASVSKCGAMSYGRMQGASGAQIQTVRGWLEGAERGMPREIVTNGMDSCMSTHLARRRS